MKNSSFHDKSDAQPRWIDTPPKLDELIGVLATEPLIAVDTESDSLFSYYEKVCLIQFSTPEADYLVDPLAIDVSGLDTFFASSSIQKIFHAAEYDFLSLKRDYGFTFESLFDTMLAARILGWERYGLGALLEKHFGIKLNKRFQRYNWGQRPLSKEALNYARLDTHYLIQLRQIQLKELNQQHRLREALEAFERATLVEPTPKLFDPNDFWRVKNAKFLKPQQQAILRELFILRDGIARKLDRPPFKVMHDATLIELAKAQPQSYSSLKKTKGVGQKLVHYNGDKVLQAIRNGQSAEPPRYPSNNHRPDDNVMNRYETLRQWRNNIASKRGVEPDVIISNHILMLIARSNPQTLNTLTKLDVLGNWQREMYGKRLVEVLNTRS